MYAILFSTIFVTATIVFFSGLFYTVHKFRQAARASEKKAFEIHWIEYVSHYRPFKPRRSL